MWSAEAPSNIALIKYMGKHDKNVPFNKSLSYTIDRFNSRVEMEIIDSDKDKFEPLDNVGYLKLEIPEAGMQRFINHLIFLKREFNCRTNFLIRSGNNFPNDTGIASSASSFAALTMCAVKAICEIQHIDLPDIYQITNLSRMGSGSSCRSFFSPWAVGEEEGAFAIDLPYKNLHHRLALIESAPKKVSSSQAHNEVLTSLLFDGRPERALRRFNELVAAMQAMDWHKIFVISWQEFQDMHALFNTSRNPFGYMTSATLEILAKVMAFWDLHKDGPVVTVDAGPNIHFLWRDDQSDLLEEFYDNCEFVLM